MLAVAEAVAAIRAALRDPGTERVALVDCVGRVLRMPVTAERDQPPYDRVTMDGIALRHAAFAAGRRRFRVAGTQHAGDPPLTLGDDADCIEIMTGAVLPPGSDCVIPVERLRRGDDAVVIEDGYAAEARQNVHPRASDHARGTRLLEPGRRIAALDVALLASAGLAEVEVARLPAVRVVSTGNELVAAGQPIADHQVRLSNGPALVAMLAAQGFRDTRDLHLPDEPAALEARIGAELAACDVLILSGGVSMGQADFVPQVLDALGVGRVFHRISQKPGKPMWFGTGPAGQLVFALPGNPVSALTCARHYVLPALLEACGAQPAAAVTALLAADWRFAPPLTLFLPVRAEHAADGSLHAVPVPPNTSGDFSALAGTDGYLALDRDTTDFPAGSRQSLYFWERL